MGTNLLQTHSCLMGLFCIDDATWGKTSRMVFYSGVIRIIWKYLLQTWTTRNTALHPPTPTEYTIAQLHQQVEHLLHITKQDPATNHLVKNVTSKHIMQQSHARIKQWITTGAAQIKAHITAAKQRAKIQTRDIWHYFNCTTPQHKDSLKPP